MGSKWHLLGYWWCCRVNKRKDSWFNSEICLLWPNSNFLLSILNHPPTFIATLAFFRFSHLDLLLSITTQQKNISKLAIIKLLHRLQYSLSYNFGSIIRCAIFCNYLGISTLSLDCCAGNISCQLEMSTNFGRIFSWWCRNCFWHGCGCAAGTALVWKEGLQYLVFEPTD